ncbi:MAG: response regulator [Elusimicrobia bacterium]|nr:response regulator [Elusimicrobiota bacterium]
MIIKKVLGTHDIARICHVTPPAVINWLDSGKIPSFTTGGGHRRVWDRDLVVFMKEHNMPIPPELASEAKLRILIVDDEAQNRKLINRIVRKQYPEAEIEEAADGFEAGHKINTLLPTLVVLDIQLPGVDGLKVCRTIRGDQRFSGIKILVITGHNLEEARKQALEAGANDFLGKPFSIEELADSIGRLLK